MSDFEQERWDKGMEVLRKMGREKTMLNQKELYPDLYKLSVGYLFGEIWSRGHLTLRERELITMACNICMARPNGTHSHEEIMELIIQVGHYAGWPAMAHAVIQYEEVLKEDGAKKK
jgi:4-carboxymuconolactone decarboxylase